MIAENLAAHHNHCLALSRIYLAGHNRAARFVCGQGYFRYARVGTAGKESDVARDFQQIGCKRIQRAVKIERRVF